MAEQTHTPAVAKNLSVEPLESKDARWLGLVQITYQNIDGKERKWEAVQRTTRPKASEVDAVHILAVLAGDKGSEILLVKQFRPPMNNICVEFPAGLVDEGQSPEEAAVRELREETGYVGKAIPEKDGGRRPVLMSGPGISNSNSLLIHVEIDMSLPANQNPVPKLEDGEFIETFTVPLKNLHTELRKLERAGLSIDGKVGAFAEGIESASRWRL